MKYLYKACLFLEMFIIGLPSIAQNHIVISKMDFKLLVLNPKKDTLMVADVALGKNFGNKRKEGDCKTPEGFFKIIQIKDSSHWLHDFNDGFGKRVGAFGPYFIRLNTPITHSIGIHGTCFPESIGTRSSEGCVRLRNEDILRLVKLVKVGDDCKILPDM